MQPVQPQPLNMNFANGLNTKTDPWQVPFGQFLRFRNSVFVKGGMLKKRNGFGSLPSLPDSSYNYVTTLNDNLTAIGQNIAAYNSSSRVWTPKGSIQPISLSVLPLVRNSLNQAQCDSVVAANGLSCTVYTETNAGASTYKYVIANSVTGQNIISPTLIPVSSGVVTGSPRVFLLGGYFVIVFTNVITATSHLQYISISVSDPTLVTSAADIVSAYISATTVAWDGVVYSDRLYVAYNTTSGGQSVKITYLGVAEASQGDTPVAPTTFAAAIATMMSLCVDSTVGNPLVYISFYDLAGTTGYTASVDLNIQVVQAPVQTISSGTVLNIASAAQGGVCSVFYEVSNAYSYDAAVKTNFVNLVTVTGASAAVAVGVCRSIGLASKAFIIDGVIYFLGAYHSQFQDSYFLMNGTSRSASPKVVAKVAYENGGGYLTLGLPGVTVTGSVAQIPYLFKDLIEPLSVQNNTQQTTTGGVYAQTGINLASFNFDLDSFTSIEIANGIQVGGGFGWLYDGFMPVEQGFFVWPENVEVSGVSTAGGLIAQQYFYQAIYEWTDNQGNIQRSAASIPVSYTIVTAPANFTANRTSGSPTLASVSAFTNLQVGQPISGTGIPASTYILSMDTGAGTITMSQNATSGTATSTTVTPTTLASLNVNVPTYRLTYKVNTPVKILIYRWSAAQQIYYQTTSVTSATLSSTTSDSVTFVDSHSDAQISGNSVIYTTGGVVEDIAPPSTNIMTTFDTRGWLINAEDPNVLWFTKSIIEATPPQWSDQLTMYIAPNAGTVSTTGPMTAIAPMDDKLIIFKKNAMYYINGIGPDNTGNPNPAYNGPIFITATVGCTNQNSIVLIDKGLMFQSAKGIYLLPRGISEPVYIGAPVEDFNASTVQSAVSISNANEVRFTLNTGQTLMYDYFFSQWGTFEGAPAVSSCIYQNQHTLISASGLVYQETPGIYLDGVNPVLMGFTTGWINWNAIQGFQRFYHFYFIGKYHSPHKLNIQLYYNYNESAYQSTVVNPNRNNFSSSKPSPFGEQPAPFGSPIDLEQWKIYPRQQKCQSFQISIDEIFDPALGAQAGAGLTMSGLNMLAAVKRGSRPIRASQTAG